MLIAMDCPYQSAVIVKKMALLDLLQSKVETMVYVHSNLHLLYRMKDEWLKGKTKMWDVFPNDMGLDNSVELALASLDLNELLLEPVTFYDGDPLEGSSSTPADADLGLARRRMERAEAVVMTLMILTWSTNEL
jgi:hypothetical protein